MHQSRINVAVQQVQGAIQQVQCARSERRLGSADGEIENGAKSVHIVSDTGRLTFVLLRREVTGRATAFGRRLSDLVGQLEIYDFQMPIISNNNVGRFEITVDDSLCVNRLQSAGKLTGPGKDLLSGRKSTLCAKFSNMLLKRDPFNLSHYEEEILLLLDQL